jgi:hypothetical protein
MKVAVSLYGMKVAVSLKQLPSYHTVPATTLRNPARPLYGKKVAVSLKQLPSYHTVPATTLRNPARQINRTLYHML